MCIIPKCPLVYSTEIIFRVAVLNPYLHVHSHIQGSSVLQKDGKYNIMYCVNSPK